MDWNTIHADWMRRYRTRTDLALEAREVIIEREGPPEIPGVAVETEKTPVGIISRVAITTAEGARAMGKLPGHYSTIEAPAIRQRDQEAMERVAELIARELETFLARWQVPPDGEVLVVGLGNWNATPDAVGPRTVHHLVVTRHFYYLAPPAARVGARPVAGVSPGVLGITGLETAEIVLGIVRQMRPALVVCIDALAARSTERLGSTVQIADAGIQPGSGVGNKRFGITRETLGVPVLAIGVPTVVHAVTVVADGLARLSASRPPAGRAPVEEAAKEPPAPPAVATAANRLPLPDPAWILHPGGIAAAGNRSGPAGPVSRDGAAPATTASAPPAPFTALAPPGPHHGPAGPVGSPPPGEAVPRDLLAEVLGPYMGELIMTPKEIDVLVEDVAQMLAEGLNQGLHPNLDLNRLILAASGAVGA